MGYDRIDLLGVSYGTQVALAYLSLYPRFVRSIILDGVAPLDMVLGETMRADAQRSLDLIFQRCADDSSCQQQYPHLKSEFYDLLSNLQARPVEISIPNPVTGEQLQVELTPLLAGTTIRLMSYSDAEAALIPLMIHSAAQEQYDLLASQYLLMAGSLGDSVSIGMYYSVWCNEDYPFLPKEGELGNYYLQMDPTLWGEVCQRWPTVKETARIPMPQNKDVPVLLISGGDDPVTPPANAERVAKALPNSLNLVIPGMGHNNFYQGCLPAVIGDFINAGSVNNLNTACVSDIHPMPFFLKSVGAYQSPLRNRSGILMIVVTHLQKNFGKVTAFKDVSFRAEDGQVTGLLGPNGAGKTTTLRVLYTILKPDPGSAMVDGFDVPRARSRCRSGSARCPTVTVCTRA